ncbi:MAG: hypothetical protein FJ096_05310 [Deltaproteobacteria bacterium]|nr:hypothetical protein [Deltaproteobacteria bacterium]
MTLLSTVTGLTAGSPGRGLLAASLVPFALAACGDPDETSTTTTSTEVTSVTTTSGGGTGGSGGSGDGGSGGGLPASEVRLHLVVDSGSSGTRFCVFDVKRELESKRCSIGAAPSICGKGSGGLAALTNGKPPAEVPDLVLPKFQDAWKALEDAWVQAGRDKAELATVEGAAALGTGGYRDPVTAEPAMNPAWDQVWKSFEAYFKTKGIPSYVAKAIPGEDEARLAWVGVREAVAPTEPFAIIETGGATLQLASGAPTDAYDALARASIYRGLNYELDQLKADPGFAVCSTPTNRSKQDGAKCVSFLIEKVHSNDALTELAKTISTRPLYGLGAPWTGLFQNYPNMPPWAKKTGPELHDAFTLTNLNALTALVCPMSDEDLAAIAPESFDVVAKTGLACYRTAYQTAEFDSVKVLAKDESIRAGGDDQWARGASVTGKFFADCQ